MGVPGRGLGRGRRMVGLAGGLKRQELRRLLQVGERELGPVKRAEAEAGERREEWRMRMVIYVGGNMVSNPALRSGIFRGRGDRGARQEDRAQGLW